MYATQNGWFSNEFYTAGFTRDANGIYHARQDALQQYAGYNGIYDFVFDLATSMKAQRFEFSINNEKYAFWAWKGDYLNLGAGAELGIYKNAKIDGKNTFHWIVDTNLSLYMTLQLKNKQGKIIFNYTPSEKQWWITGFDPYIQNVKAEELTAIYTINFSSNTKMYDAFISSKSYLENKDKWATSKDNKYKLIYTF